MMKIWWKRLKDVENKENEISILKFLDLKDERFKNVPLFFKTDMKE